MSGSISGIYRKGYAAGFLLLIGPFLFGIVLSVPHWIYPKDCDLAARCKHLIVDATQPLLFGLVYLGPPIMLLGIGVLFLVGVIHGLGNLLSRRR